MLRVSEVEVDGQLMKLYDSADGQAKVGDDAPHAHYAIKRSDVHTEVSAFKTIATRIGHVTSVVELFGGSGWHSSIIQRVCKPEYHTAVDISEDCTRSISASLPKVSVYQADSYEWASSLLPGNFEWIHADFNNLTYMKWRSGSGRIPSLVDQIFKCAGRWVTLTDSAAFGLVRFAKNREAYRRVFHGPITSDSPTFEWQDYFQRVADVIRTTYGFQCRDAVVWRRMAGMLLLERSPVAGTFTVREHKEKVAVRLVETRNELPRSGGTDRGR